MQLHGVGEVRHDVLDVDVGRGQTLALQLQPSLRGKGAGERGAGNEY